MPTLSLESTLLTPHAPVAAPPLPPEGALIAQGSSLAQAAVSAVWPSIAAGELLEVSVGSDREALLLRVAHLGSPLGVAAREALTRSLSQRLAQSVRFEDVALPADPITREDGDLSFIAGVATVAQASRGLADVVLCLTRPDGTAPRHVKTSQLVALGEAVDRALDTHPRVTTMHGEDFTIRLARGKCPPPDEPAAPKAR